MPSDVRFVDRVPGELSHTLRFEPLNGSSDYFAGRCVGREGLFKYGPFFDDEGRAIRKRFASSVWRHMGGALVSDRHFFSAASRVPVNGSSNRVATIPNRALIRAVPRRPEPHSQQF